MAEYDAKLYLTTIHQWDDISFARGVIVGDAKGRFSDGCWIRTSSIQSIEESSNIIQTLNTRYLMVDGPLPENIQERIF